MVKRAIAVSTALILASSLAACGDDNNQNPTGGGGPASNPERASDAANEGGQALAPQAAVAELHPTKGSEVTATVHFTPVDGALRVQTEAEHLKPGKHAYHIHVYGNCTGAHAETAGPHFNLQNPGNQDADRILGNLGELEVGERGIATASTMLEHASLIGPSSIIGRAVVIHARGNLPSEPPGGAAGPREACGVIGIAK